MPRVTQNMLAQTAFLAIRAGHHVTRVVTEFVFQFEPSVYDEIEETQGEQFKDDGRKFLFKTRRGCGPDVPHATSNAHEERKARAADVTDTSWPFPDQDPDLFLIEQTR